MGRRGYRRKNICWTDRAVRRTRESGYRQIKENNELHCKPHFPIGGASILHFHCLLAIHPALSNPSLRWRAEGRDLLCRVLPPRPIGRGTPRTKTDTRDVNSSG